MEQLLDLALFAAVLVTTISMVLGVAKASAVPRLRVSYGADGKWRVTPRDLAQYLVSIVPLLYLWSSILLFTGLLIPKLSNGEELAFTTTSFIMAVRVIAHFRPGWADIAMRVYAMLLVSSVLLWGETRPESDMQRIADQVFNSGNLDLQDYALFGAEFVAATVWFFWGVRKRAWRGYNVPGIPWDEYPQAQANRASAMEASGPRRSRTKRTWDALTGAEPARPKQRS
ncbi:MAG: hypothetical protein ACOYD0_00045 [Candidatus Nanopelagicales bacterium]